MEERNIFIQTELNNFINKYNSVLEETADDIKSIIDHIDYTDDVNIIDSLASIISYLDDESVYSDIIEIIEKI